MDLWKNRVALQILAREAFSVDILKKVSVLKSQLLKQNLQN